MRNKLIWTLGSVLICLTRVGWGQSYGDFYYTMTGTNVTITKYSGLDGDVTVPSIIPGAGTVTTIGELAFLNSSVSTVVVPDTVLTIQSEAFDDCHWLTNVIIGSSVTSIEENTFSGCWSLPDITIPASVTNFASSAFYYCRKLTTINVDPLNPSYSSLDGVLFNKDQSTLLVYPSGKPGAYSIPNGVTYIWDMAFEECPSLTSVTLPNTVTNIGSSAFFDCSALSTITLPMSVTNLGFSPFNGCSGLTDAYFEGNAPALLGADIFIRTAPSFSVHYPSYAMGWTSPTWNGYPTTPYIPALGPALSVIVSNNSTIRLSWHATVGSSYQVRYISDLSTTNWQNLGSAISASTDGLMTISEAIEPNSQRLYRLLAVEP